MAGKPFPVIDVIDLSHVRGGFERSAVVQRALVQAMGGHAMTRYADIVQAIGGHAMTRYADTDRAARTKDDGAAKATLSLISRKPHRRSGSGPASGPTPAPALPPTSTLTR